MVITRVVVASIIAETTIFGISFLYGYLLRQKRSLLLRSYIVKVETENLDEATSLHFNPDFEFRNVKYEGNS